MTKRDYKLARIPIELETTLKGHPKYGLGRPFVQSLRLVTDDIKNNKFMHDEKIVRLELRLEEMLYGKKKKLK